MSLFVDTSIWYAAADVSDPANRRSQEILTAGEALITTDHVVLETWTLIRNRMHRRAAERFWEGMRSAAVIVEPVSMADMEAAWHIGLSYPDQDFSLADLTSFAVMRRLGLDRAASLDDHFAVFRFGPARKLAFTIVR